MRLAQIHDAGFILGMSLFMYLCNQHSRTGNKSGAGGEPLSVLGMCDAKG